MNKEAHIPGNFRELKGEVDGTWNKIKLTSKFLVSCGVYAVHEYYENAMAVITNKDPSVYSAEKQGRRGQMVAKVGKWAVRHDMTA